MRLDLDRSFAPYPAQQPLEYELFTFSGGEPHIKIAANTAPIKQVNITHRLTSFNQIGEVLVAVNALRNMGIENITLTIPYFPGSRQDRVAAQGEALTAKVYAALINNLQLKEIKIFDPHSDVTPALLNNCKVTDNHKFIEQVIEQVKEEVLLVSPDGGALKKVYKLAAYLNQTEVIECAKHRDTATGKLSGFRVYADDLQNKSCLIVDDICDGGGTFIGIAKELKQKNAGKLYLAVSHGIFSKGITELAKYYDHIYTTDSFSTLQEHPQLTQIKLSETL